MIGINFIACKSNLKLNILALTTREKWEDTFGDQQDLRDYKYNR